MHSSICVCAFSLETASSLSKYKYSYVSSMYKWQDISYLWTILLIGRIYIVKKICPRTKPVFVCRNLGPGAEISHHILKQTGFCPSGMTQPIRRRFHSDQSDLKVDAAGYCGQQCQIHIIYHQQHESEQFMRSHPVYMLTAGHSGGCWFELLRFFQWALIYMVYWIMAYSF